MKKNIKYYIGLDCGTSSVGWAVTDDAYNLLTANSKTKTTNKTKTKQRALWGVRLFDEADTAAERRGFRSSRRRTRRANERLKLLRMLFREEMKLVDPEFYKRLHESFYYIEDKHLKNNSKNTLFNDPDFTDKDFHRQYPTIWHLRQAIIKSDERQHFDLRLYFLAIQHILKHRGHFLLEGKMQNGNANFSQVFDNFYNACENFGYRISDSVASDVERIICDKTKGKLDKKKELADILFIEGDDPSEDTLKGQSDLAGLLVGSKVSLNKIFNLDGEDYKYSFAEGVLEDKLPEIESAIGGDNLDLILATKQVYDYAILRNLLGDHSFISDAMVANYNQHQQDLRELKQIFKPHKDIYRQLFRTAVYNEKFPSYNAYIGTAYTEDKQGRKSTKNINQEDFNKFLKKQLKEIGHTGPLLDRADKGELLPKQRGQTKGTIPQQLHHNELGIILAKLGKDFPSFAKEVPGEDVSYNTKCKKIAKIHSFRIPYYCGPIVSKDKSQFSWTDEEISELVRPWNFDQLVNKEARADNFIRRMTNECTYLIGEDVLPKSSLIYQKYMVLNELNNLRINGQPLDIDLKQEIYEHAFWSGELTGNITLRKLEKWLQDYQYIGHDAKLSGTSEVKSLPKLKTHQDFCKCLGLDYSKRYSQAKLENVVEAITILGEEKTMLQGRIQKELGCSEDVAKKLAKLSYKDWGRFSQKFLSGITVNNRTILDWLWESQYNLRQLLGQEIGFEQKVEEVNSSKKLQSGTRIKYSDVKELYCSPAVKRSVWQTIKIVDELVKARQQAPTKIFLEVTRGDNERAKGRYTLARKKDLEAKLKAIKIDDARAILQELGQKEDRDLQSKKLFLYFSQMGKCAYSGEPIPLEELNNTTLYDIDHIYPRSLTKDDSITQNLVLVKANLNRSKTNIYPIAESIRTKMTSTWVSWRRAGLITQEKYDRLTRATSLTDDELGGFIARQIVETSQAVKSIRDLLKRAYPDTEVVLVKAGQVSDFRHLFANGVKHRNSDTYKVPPRPEFIKIRELNDYHHAKDAYLNIVVGNVMNATFTSNPYEWVKRRKGKEYSIRPERLFRDSLEYEKDNGDKTIYPEVKSWDFANSIKLVSDTMKRNDIMWTRMSYIESSEISDLQIIGKNQKTDGILPIKHGKRLAQIDKYGGYNSIKGAHFALIECQDKKGNSQRRIVSIPQIYKDDINKYIAKKYQHAKVILPVIKYKSLLRFEAFPLHIAGKSSSGLIFYSAKQLILSQESSQYLKKLLNVCRKDQEKRGGYEIDESKDGISASNNMNILSELCDKLDLFKNMPGFQSKVSEIREHKNDFQELDLKTQVTTIINFVKMLKCNAETGDISSFVPKSSFLGKAGAPEDVVSRCNIATFINQSPTGLYEEIINLKTVQPQPAKTPRKS